MGLSIVQPREPYAGKAFASGVGTYIDQTNKNKEFGLQERRISQQGSQFQQSHGLDVDRLEYQKRKAVLDSLDKILADAPEDKARELLDDPDLIKLYKADKRVMPVPGSGKKPGSASWLQEQQTSALKEGLNPGVAEVTTYGLMGTPVSNKVTSEAEARRFIHQNKRSVTDFEEELKVWREIDKAGGVDKWKEQQQAKALAPTVPTKPKAQSGGESGGLVKGQVYPDGKGNYARYLGGDKLKMKSWQPMNMPSIDRGNIGPNALGNMNRR